MNHSLYCAIIGDINKSRSLPERKSVQTRFRKAISHINQEFRKEIVSPFMITLGDEFQGLLYSPRESYRLVRRLQDMMHPVSLSFGTGIGTLSTRINRREVTLMDGEAFHRARAALNHAKKKKRELVYDFAGEWLPMVNALVGVMEAHRMHLTKRQRAIAILLQSHTQEKLAAKLNISQQAISKVHRSTASAQMTEAETALHDFLNGFTKRNAR